MAGLAENYASVQDLPPEIPYLAVTAGLGGLIGSELGGRRLRNEDIRRALAVVLVVAGLKLTFN